MSAATTMLARAEARYDAAIKAGDARKAARAKETMSSALIHVDIERDAEEAAQKKAELEAQKEKAIRADGLRVGAEAAATKLNALYAEIGGVDLAGVSRKLATAKALFLEFSKLETEARAAGAIVGVVVPPGAATIQRTFAEAIGSRFEETLRLRELAFEMYAFIQL